jgi:hypothetical protein
MNLPTTVKIKNNMAKKRIDIPDDDMTTKLAGGTPTHQPYPTVPAISAPPPVATPVVAPVTQPTIVAEMVKKVGGRPIKETSVGRIKYTTSLTKEAIRFLRVEAAMRDISPADFLDLIIKDFREKGN